METLKILKKLVSFNTAEDLQNNEIIEWVENYLKENGFKCKRIIEKATKRTNLLAQIGKEPILAFSGHLDTVNATDGWESDPLRLKIDEKYAYGLGVCDMKGGIASFLKACSNIDKNKLKKGLKLFFTFDEEIDFKGIELLVSKGEKFPEYLILPEPTDLKPVVATKGCMEMKVNFFGKACHSSMPDRGINAIVEAYKFIGELLNFANELKNERNDLFPIPYTTINIGKIKGGDAVNKVPDKCTIQFDARTISEKHNEIIEKKVKQLLKKYNSNFEITIDIKANINNDNNMITKIESICKNNRIAENYVTEASFIHGSKAIILGLGPITAHQSNEHIELSKLNELVQIYENIIKEYCY